MKKSNKFILIDTREKAHAIVGILDYFDRAGIRYERTKLRAGDYRDYNRPGLVIDRKKNMGELAKNCTDPTDRERFRRELERIEEVGAELVILVEQNRYKDRDEWVQVRSIVDLIRWSSPYTMVRGERIYRILADWTFKHRIRVIFCDRRSTGRYIEKILYEGETEPQEGKHGEEERDDDLLSGTNKHL